MVSEMNDARLTFLRDGTELHFKDRFTIGRSLSNSHVIEELAVSRVHCIFEKDASDKWTVTDKSSNGTQLNSVKMLKNVPYTIHNSDTITLSDNIKFKFTVQDSNDSTILVASDQLPIEVINLVDSFGSASKSKKPTLKKVVHSVPTLVSPAKDNTASSETAQPSTSNAIDFEEELACSICTELMVKAVTLNCQHSFCTYCITMWRKNKNLCPICKTKIKEQVSTLLINNLVDKVVQNLPAEERKRRQAIVAERGKESKPKAKKKCRKVSVTAGRRTRRAVRDVPIEISSDDTESSGSDLAELQVDLEDMSDIDPYYGGYGICFICHNPGHWANGCPSRYLCM